MRAFSGIVLLIVVVAVAGVASAGAPVIDPAPFKEALEKHLEKKIRENLVDEELDPERETPIRVEVREFTRLRPKGTQAEATARVAIVGDESGNTKDWEVEFELKDGAWQVAKIQVPHPDFGTVNYVVLLVYLLAMLAIGWWTSRFIKGTRSFFIADGRLNYIVVGISITTAYLSALTMMALPGVAFGKLDWLYPVQLPFLILTAFVITRFVLKRYRDAGVISVYEYLEQRIHVSARLLASLSYIFFAIGRMGLVLFLPALAFSLVTGADLVLTIVVMGAVVTIYTMVGGIEAVIWTDFAQAFIILGGAVVSVVYVLAGTGGAEFSRIAGEHHKFRMIASGTDITKLLTLWLVLETIFQTIRMYGSQQDLTQRYMTTPSTKHANRSVWIGILAYIPLGFLFYFIGSALFVYYQANPDPAVAALIANGRMDAIYPYFVASKLPPVLAGLVVAAIFAAAMSSIDACMNACSTVCVEDFYRRFAGRDLPDEHHLGVARLLTFAWGILGTLMALSFMNIQYAQIVWGKLLAITTTGVLGLMVLAFLPRRVNRWAAVIGYLASCACQAVMLFFLQVEPHVALVAKIPEGASGINFLLWPVISNLVCFAVALLVDAAIRTCCGTPQED